MGSDRGKDYGLGSGQEELSRSFGVCYSEKASVPQFHPWGGGHRAAEGVPGMDTSIRNLQIIILVSILAVVVPMVSLNGARGDRVGTILMCGAGDHPGRYVGY